jgi:hypothetical protein
MEENSDGYLRGFADGVCLRGEEIAGQESTL